MRALRTIAKRNDVAMPCEKLIIPRYAGIEQEEVKNKAPLARYYIYMMRSWRSIKGIFSQKLLLACAASSRHRPPPASVLRHVRTLLGCVLEALGELALVKPTLTRVNFLLPWGGSLGHRLPSYTAAAATAPMLVPSRRAERDAFLTQPMAQQCRLLFDDVFGA